MKLLVDIGNTRIKWATENKHIIQESRAVNHHSLTFIEKIKQTWLGLGTPEIIAVSSVSKQQIVDQLLDLAKNIWPNITVIMAKSSSQGFSVKNAYQDATKLGVDRWLGLIALQHYYPDTRCIIDCGTAITLDVLDVQGQHLGGLISPGLQLMKQSLSSGTERLSADESEFSVGLACYTEAAIYSGTLLAAVGLIEKVLADLCNGSDNIILTGGDALVLSRHLKCQYIIEPDFILKGLSLYSRLW